MKHDGNLEITKENAKDYTGLTEVTGYLRVHSNAKLDAPNLQTVGGDLYVDGSSKLDAPALQTVGGYLRVYSDAKLDAPNLQTVGGDLSVYGSEKLDAPNLQTVGGDLSVYGSAKLDALQTVGGYLAVYGSAKLDALQTVGGYLYVHSNAKLEALQTVGGYLYARNAKLEAPNAKHNYAEAKTFCNKALEESFKKQGLIKADGILSWVKSEEHSNDITIYEVLIVGKTKNSFLVRKGDVFAHGITKQEAILDLEFKANPKDTTQYKTWSLEEQKPILEMAIAYRRITGACRQGVNNFISQIKDKKESYSFKEVEKLTNGHFGHEVFKSFIGSKE